MTNNKDKNRESFKEGVYCGVFLGFVLALFLGLITFTCIVTEKEIKTDDELRDSYCQSYGYNYSEVSQDKYYEYLCVRISNGLEVFSEGYLPSVKHIKSLNTETN